MKEIFSRYEVEMAAKELKAATMGRVQSQAGQRKAEAGALVALCSISCEKDPSSNLARPGATLELWGRGGSGGGCGGGEYASAFKFTCLRRKNKMTAKPP